MASRYDNNLFSIMAGTLKNTINLSLPTSGCGVRLNSYVSEEGATVMSYKVVLVAQQDRHLRQASDTERTIECIVSENAFLVKSKPMKEAIEKEILGHNKGSSR